MEPLVDYVINQSGYVNHLYDSDPVAAELDMDNINEFLSIAREFDMRDMDYEARTLSGFLEEIASTPISISLTTATASAS